MRRWKITLSLALMLVLCLTLQSRAFAADEDFVIDDNGTLVKYTGNDSVVVIPDGVKELGTGAFHSLNNLTDIRLPDTLTTIKAASITYCYNLTYLDIPEGVENIGTIAFESARSLKAISLPKSLATVGELVFDRCDELTDIYYAGSEEEWKDIDFQNVDGPGSTRQEIIDKHITVHYNCNAPVVYSVVYDGNTVLEEEVDGVPHGQLKSPGIKLTLASATPTREGYVFLGWSTEQDATTASWQPGDFFNDDTAVGSNTNSIRLYAIWSPAQYQIVYDANAAGVTGVPDSQTKTCWHNLALRSGKPEREGFDFLGWSTNSLASTGVYQPGGSLTVDLSDAVMDGKATLYAIWRRSVYTIVYNGNAAAGVSGLPANQAKTYGQELSLSDGEPTRAGFHFLGWSADSGAQTASWQPGDPFNGDALAVNKTITLYAVWEKTTADITFNANGGAGSMDGQSVAKGTTAKLNACEFTRQYHTFTGWSTESGAAGVVYEDCADVTLWEDLTLYAQWSQKPVTVTFDANGGTGTMQPQSMSAGDETALLENTFSRAHYTFAGWNTKANGTGTSYADKQPVTPESDLTLYAQWSKNTVTVTFHANDGSGNQQTQTVPEAEETKLASNPFSHTYYTFTGWSTESGVADVVYTNGQDVTLWEDLTLYAQWSQKPVTVTFDANDGSGNQQTQTVPEAEETKLASNPFTRTYYTFTGWSTESGVADVVYTNGQDVTLTEDLTLYAQWTQDAATVTFDANGGTGTMQPQIVPKGTATPLNANAFTRGKYAFTGWNTKANGTGTSYADKQPVTPESDLTLYAQWKSGAGTYTVYFDANGGRGEMPSQSFTYGVSQRLYACVFENGDLSFAGWALTRRGSVVYEDRETVRNLTAKDGGTVTLYAVWTDDAPTAHVSIRRGNSSYGRSDGRQGEWYRFSVSSDIYNLVMQIGGRTVTRLVRANGREVNGYADLPSGTGSSVLAVRPGTPDVVVGGLDEAANERYFNEPVTLTMTVARVPENQGNAQHSAIRSAAGSRNLEFYDLTLSRTLGRTDDRTFNGETSQCLSVYFPMYAPSQDIEVYRCHNGRVETLPFDPQQEEYAAFENGWLLIYAKKFSTYAISSPKGSCPRDYSCPISAYSDASAQAWYHDGVHWALGNQVMIGFPRNQFKPNDNISRAQIVVMLWRLSGCPGSSQSSPFSDVQRGDWFNDAVCWATAMGYVKGRSPARFAPNDAITREELASILYRYAKRNDAAASDLWLLFLSDYADSGEISDWAYEAMSWATNTGIIEGMPTSSGSRRLDPHGSATRAQTATMLMRCKGEE